MAILVDTQQRGRLEDAAGFLEGFPHDGLEQGLVRIQMAGGLIEAPAVLGILLDEEKAAAAFGDRGDGHVGFPEHGRAAMRGLYPCRLRCSRGLRVVAPGAI